MEKSPVIKDITTGARGVSDEIMPVREVKLAGISGSLRKGSWNTRLLCAAGEMLPQNVEMEILTIGELPLYNGDLDLPLAKERPPVVTRFREALARAEGLVIASPEYNYSIPGVLKNALDWASRGDDAPIRNMPVIIMGASTSYFGTVRMQLAIEAVFLTMGMRTIPKPEVMIPKAEDKFDINGTLSDHEFREKVRLKLEKLVTLIRTESPKA